MTLSSQTAPQMTSSDLSDSEPEDASAQNLITGWSEKMTWVDTQFHRDHIGPQNIPDHINSQSSSLSFLDLYLNADFWRPLCHQTNLQAEQVKQSKPTSYYAKNFKPVAVPEMKSILGLRLQMENCVIKPRHVSYWQGVDHNFIACIPGSGKSLNATASSPFGAFCTWSIRQKRLWTSLTKFTK